MSEQSNRTPIDDDMEDALMRLVESTQDIQRRVFRSARRGFLTGAAVAELQYGADSVARDVAELAEKVGIAPLEKR